MAEMSAEEEARDARDLGAGEGDPGREVAYDRSVEPGVAVPDEVSQADANTASDQVIRPRWVVALGTALVFLVGQGGGVVLLPYGFTHWQSGTAYPFAVRGLGVALIAVGGFVVITGFIRFVTEGVGVPLPIEPTSRQLTVGGPYRFVRNPLYVAIVMAVTGQALLLSRSVLLVYAAVLLAAFIAFVRWHEEPTLARRFGAEYQAYCKRVPAWWPRLPHSRR